MSFVAVCGVLCGCSVIGIRFVQWKLGVAEIWEPVTGTHAYDNWLIGVPMYAMFWLAVAWTIVGGVFLLSRRQTAGALLLLVTVWPAWLAIELGMIFVFWEPASP
ncbi:MAG TPA: hypothetical protein VF595_11180 [Tepidisphaeraceae bacterium]